MTKRRKRISSAKSVRSAVKSKPIESGPDGAGVSRPRLAGLLAVIVLGLVVNCIALDWGRSGLVPWSPDSLEGITIVREMPRLFKQWTYKYPRGHFLLNGVFYHPLIKHWEKNPVMRTMPDGRVSWQTLTMERLDFLAQITRIISVVMGAATVVAVFLIGRLFFEDYLAGVLAALTLSLTQLFAYYCHHGTVHVPHLCWFAWGFYWMVAGIYGGKWRHYVLMGLFFSLSVCTYDSVAGYIAGMGLAYWLAVICKGRGEGKSVRIAVLSVFSKKILAGAIVFLFCYALLQGILTSPKVFIERMTIWTHGGRLGEFNQSFTSQLSLLWSACTMLYGSFGWPLLGAATAAIVYLSVKHPWKVVFLMLPLIAFYLIIIVYIRLIAPRYLLVGFVGLSLATGKACADWLRYNKLHISLRLAPVVFVYAMSLLYCIGVDLEMASDTRVRTEQWFDKNVARPSMIGAGIYNRVYAPRLYLKGYNMICPWRSSSVSGRGSSRPEYLIMTPLWPRIEEDVESEFRKKLFNGQLDYSEVARFSPKYLYPARTIFGLAGWPTAKHLLLSPEMIVFEKNSRTTRYLEQRRGVDQAR